MFKFKKNEQEGDSLPKEDSASAIRWKKFFIYGFFGLLGALIIFLSLQYEDPDVHNHWLELCIHLGQALIIGSTISLLIDLPSMVGYFKKVMIQSLVSNEYLDKLSRQNLIDLRKKTTAKIHLKDTRVVETGLIDLDEDICELLTRFYYERYRQNVSCRKEGDVIIKIHHIVEHLVNPLSSNGNSTKFTESVKNFFSKKEDENVDDLFKLLKYVIMVDQGPERNLINEGIKVISEECDATDMPYNIQASLVDKNNEPIKIEFRETLKIEKSWQVCVPKEDITFFKRLTIPAKSFRIDYHFIDSDVKLVAGCFGTLSFSDEGNIKILHQADNNISVESYSWLLPGNGVLVVTTA